MINYEIEIKQKNAIIEELELGFNTSNNYYLEKSSYAEVLEDNIASLKDELNSYKLDFENWKTKNINLRVNEILYYLLIFLALSFFKTAKMEKIISKIFYIFSYIFSFIII